MESCEETFLSLEQCREIPKHVAIIMDGNRRWARANGKFIGGHKAGAEAIPPLVEAAIEYGLETLTLFAFSTENWNRPQIEVDLLMKLFESYLQKHSARMQEQGVRLSVIGDLEPLSRSLKRVIRKTIEETKEGTKLDLVIACNYGGRDELRRVCVQLANQVVSGELKGDEINEEKIASCLDTARFSDPDLLIRTGGEKRVSNFLLWQLAYSEVYLTDRLWPDFGPEALLEAMIDYGNRERRRGS